MKKLKWILLIVIAALTILVIFNYPRLNIVSGYSAKNMSSSVFVANRSADYTDTNDNNTPLVNLAKDVVNVEEKWASASVYGLMNRKAVYREGLGSVLINDDYDPDAPYLTPKRQQTSTGLSYPYGDLPQKDTVFPEVDYTALQKAVENAFKEGEEPVKNTRAVVVIYKDQIIAEQYVDGFTKDSKILGWSMTKSLVSTMYGVLVKNGKLTLEALAPIEEWQNDERKNITINDLLQMNSGLEWDEDYFSISDVTRMLFLASDMTRLQIDKELLHEPGTSWNYSSGTSNLLSGILRKQFKTHQEYLDFPYREFIDKIGMHSMTLEADLSGNYVGSSYAWATPRDWGKFGLLYLHKGNWNGEQVIDSSWVDYVATPAPDSDKRYGGHFWLNAGGWMPDVPRDAISANGFQGQRILILPSKDMVIVRFGLTEQGAVDFNEMFSGIINTVN